MAKFGLVGTITSDLISYHSGRTFEGVGGVLYQAASLCGLGHDVFLYTNLGRDLAVSVDPLIRDWINLSRQGIRLVPGPGNRVRLDYPAEGERIEVLESIVPPLDPGPILAHLPILDTLVLIVNSGFDIELRDWRKVAHAAGCPIWLDVHSLPLERVLGKPRSYVPLPEWTDWARGVDYLQANRQEVASMLGHPQILAKEEELGLFAEKAFDLEVKAVFITLGKDGVQVMTRRASKRIAAPGVQPVVDSTGCGDVFCAGTVVKLADGQTPFEAASYGVELASKAVSLAGIKETYEMAKAAKPGRKE
jgi:sugar/nucleoside kinase (ribokinase family)